MMNKKVSDYIHNIRSIGYFLTLSEWQSQNEAFLERANRMDYKVKNDILDLMLNDLDRNLQRLTSEFEKIKTINMKILKIRFFLASSTSLEDERIAIERLLYRINDKLVETNNLYLQYNVWEKHTKRFTHFPKQEDYNQNLVSKSEIFVCLVGDKLGKFTQEEFEKAKDLFLKKEKPFGMYIFFKDFSDDNSKKQDFYESDDFLKVVKFKKYIQRELQQVPGTYKTVDGLVSQIETQIESDIEFIKNSLE